jgi:hypothetical protein
MIEQATYEGKRYLLDLLGVNVKVWATDHEPRYEITGTIPLYELATENDVVAGSIVQATTNHSA